MKIGHFITFFALLLMAGCVEEEEVFANISTEVLVKNLRTASIEEINSAVISFPITNFRSYESEGAPVYIAAFDSGWFVELEVTKVFKSAENIIKRGETYAALIHSPVILLGLDMNDAIGKKTTVDFLFLKNKDGTLSLALEVPIDLSNE